MKNTSAVRWKFCIQEVQDTITKIIAMLLSYGAMYGLTGEQALPGGSIFALFLFMIWCYIGSKIAHLLRLPSLTGTLFMGFMYRNFLLNNNTLQYLGLIPITWSKDLRNAAFSIILLRAGLGLDLDVLKKMKFLYLRLGIIPMLSETLCGALCSRILFQFPWPYCFSFGFLVAGLSPAVVVPSMLILKKNGYNEKNGILTLIIAAGTLDGIFSIIGASLFIGIATATGSTITSTLIKIPIEIITGMGYGSLIGILLWYFPYPSQEYKTFYEIYLLTVGGLAINFIGLRIQSSAIGALGCITLAIIATFKWRKERKQNINIIEYERGLWEFLEIFLFGLIGAEVTVEQLRTNIGYSFMILLTGICFRLLFTYVALVKSEYNVKEKLFICLTWLPKATVQAAMGSLALDYARLLNLGDKYIQYGEMILAVCVLSIIVTAPIGAVAIRIFAPILLSKPQITCKSEENQTYIRNYGACRSEICNDQS